MKVFLTALGLMAMVTLGMSMNKSESPVEQSSLSSGITVTGTLQFPGGGACPQIVSCSGNGATYNLIDLPGTYTAGQEVLLKGSFSFGSIECGFYPTITVGAIRPTICQ